MKSVFLLLALLFLSPAAFAQKKDILFILDASQGMARELAGKRIIDWAKEAIQKGAAQLPAEAQVGFRVFGHREEAANPIQGCQDSTMLVPIGQGQARAIRNALPAIEPKGRRALDFAIEQSVKDFSGRKDLLHRIVIFTDGIDGCTNDLIYPFLSLGQAGFHFELDIVGFDVSAEAKERFELYAGEFKGKFHRVGPSEAIEKQIAEITEKLFPSERFATEGIEEAQGDILFILGASQSMGEVLDEKGGHSKLYFAKKVLLERLAPIPPNVPYGVRVYGSKENFSSQQSPCEAGDLRVPFGLWGETWVKEKDQALVSNDIEAVTAYGEAPIAYSLRMAAEDFADRKEQFHKIVLLTDGQESCAGKPLVEIQNLSQQGFKFQMDVIGLDAEGEIRDRLVAIAQAGGGSYTDIHTATEVERVVGADDIAKFGGQPLAGGEGSGDEEEAANQKKGGAAGSGGAWNNLLRLLGVGVGTPGGQGCSCITFPLWILLVLLALYLWHRHRKKKKASTRPFD